MKLKINWDDMKCIIDGVEYEIEIFNTIIFHNIEHYIKGNPHPKFYRKDGLILERDGNQYYLLKLDENHIIIGRWMLHEIKN